MHISILYFTDLLKGIKMNDFLKNLTIFGERALKAMAEENKKVNHQKVNKT